MKSHDRDNVTHRDVSRRDLVVKGGVAVAAAALVPTVFGSIMRSSRAYADAACTGALPNLVPYLTFDLQGGAALPGNFLVARPDESLLSAYSVLGWDPRSAGAVDSSFGLPMAAQASKLLAGMRQVASAGALAKFRMGSFCHISQDDSSVNRSSALALVNAAGLTGTLIPTGVGTTDQASGGNSDLAVDDAAHKPMQVNSLNDFLSAVSFGPALSGLPPSALQAMAKAAQGMSAEQAKKLAGMAHGDQLAALAASAYEKDVGFASGAVTGLDPRTDAKFAAIYGLSAATDAADPAAIFAGVAMNVLRGNCGPGVLTISGCDYHTGSNTEGDAKDLEIGQAIGRAVEAAFQLGKPLFIHILTDGGLSAADGTRNWSSDAGDKSMSVIGYFNPTAAPTQLRWQVGGFTDGQSADRGTAIGSDPSLAAFAAFANYLSVCGQLDQFDCIVPGRPFDPETLKTLMMFG